MSLSSLKSCPEALNTSHARARGMEATPEQAVEGLAIVRVLSTLLDRLVGDNAAIARPDPDQATKFHAMKVPGIAIQQYLERILKHASCSNECFTLALIYIDRLIQRNNFLLTELNVHRVVITAVLLAAKFFDDGYYSNAYYAKVGGVLVSEMNGLEVDFLFRINFSLHVTPEIFEKYRAELLSHSTPATVTEVAQARIPAPQMDSHQMLRINMQAPPMLHSQVSPSPPRETARVEDDPMQVTSQNRSADDMMVSNEAQKHSPGNDYWPQCVAVPLVGPGRGCTLSAAPPMVSGGQSSNNVVVNKQYAAIQKQTSARRSIWRCTWNGARRRIGPDARSDARSSTTGRGTFARGRPGFFTRCLLALHCRRETWKGAGVGSLRVFMAPSSSPL